MEDTSGVAFLGKGWAFPYQADSSGEVRLVEHEEAVRQSILAILSTEPGERVMRPDFGAGLRGLTFAPFNTATMTLLKYRVTQALVRWEPRIEVSEVRIRFDQPSTGLLLIDVRYRIRESNTFYNVVYPFYLTNEGRGT